jgi:hypothetical protein
MLLYILSILRYILRTCTAKHPLYIKSGFSGLATPTGLCRTLLACFARCDLPLECLLNTQTTQAGLATSKTPRPQVNLVDIAAPPSVGSCCVSTAIRELLICYTGILKNIPGILPVIPGILGVACIYLVYLGIY